MCKDPGLNSPELAMLLGKAQQKNLPGLAVFLDIEKAFDFIEWNFLFLDFNKLHFDPDVKNWV